MTANERAGVTPAGIRDGRPDVLQALVAARGSAVLAYCRAVCTPDDAPRAAAEAFARFRAAVVDAPDVAAIDPDALLLGATRHAAASLARTTRATGRADREQDTCAEVPGLLAARAAGVLGDDEGARLDSHLERCPGCRSLAADFVEAEEAYRTATSVPVPPPAERMILVALEAAAPVVDLPEEVEEPPPLEPEPEPEDEDEDDDDEEDLGPDDDQPTFEDDELDESGLFPDELPDHEDEDDEHDLPPREPRPPLRERLPRPALPSVPRPRLRRQRPAAEPVAQPVTTGEPREERRDLRPLVLPALVVLAALVVTLAAAGVFGGDEPEPPQAERQRPELRVEEPVTTPLPVEPAPPPAQTAPAATQPAPGATTTTPATTTTTPAATTPQGTTPTTTATVPAPAP